MLGPFFVGTQKHGSPRKCDRQATSRHGFSFRGKTSDELIEE